jgi:hypothetical protein
VLSSSQVSSLGMGDFIHKTSRTQYSMGSVGIRIARRNRQFEI